MTLQPLLAPPPAAAGTTPADAGADGLASGTAFGAALAALVALTPKGPDAGGYGCGPGAGGDAGQDPSGGAAPDAAPSGADLAVLAQLTGLGAPVLTLVPTPVPTPVPTVLPSMPGVSSSPATDVGVAVSGAGTTGTAGTSTAGTGTAGTGTAGTGTGTTRPATSDELTPAASPLVPAAGPSPVDGAPTAGADAPPPTAPDVPGSPSPVIASGTAAGDADDGGHHAVRGPDATPPDAVPAQLVAAQLVPAPAGTPAAGSAAGRHADEGTDRRRVDATGQPSDVAPTTGSDLAGSAATGAGAAGSDADTDRPGQRNDRQGTSPLAGAHRGPGPADETATASPTTPTLPMGSTTATASGAAGAAGSATRGDGSPTAVPDQVLRHLTSVRALREGGHRSVLRLDPEHLGEVTLTVDVHAGSVRLAVSGGADAMAAVRGGLARLRSSLAESGLALDDVALRPDLAGPAVVSPSAAGTGTGTSTDPRNPDARPFAAPDPGAPGGGGRDRASGEGRAGRDHPDDRAAGPAPVRRADRRTPGPASSGSLDVRV